MALTFGGLGHNSSLDNQVFKGKVNDPIVRSYSIHALGNGKAVSHFD